MIIPTTTTTTYSRKRSRPLAKRPLTKSLPLVALAILLAVSQASAFTGSSTLASSEAEVLPNSSLDLQKVLSSEFEDNEIDEWNGEEDEEYFDEDEWEYHYEDEEYDEEYEYEEYNEEDYENEYEYEEDWTPEQYNEMDRLYERYLEEVARKFGANWENEFELVIDKEEIYEEYLKFEEKKQQEAEEAEDRRQLVKVSHKALLQHDEDIRVKEYYNYENDSLNRTEEQDLIGSSFGKTMSADLPSRTHMIVLNTVVGYNKNNKNTIQKNNANINGQQECHATTIVTTQGGNTHTVIGSI